MKKIQYEFSSKAEYKSLCIVKSLYSFSSNIEEKLFLIMKNILCWFSINNEDKLISVIKKILYFMPDGIYLCFVRFFYHFNVTILLVHIWVIVCS